MEYHNYFAQNKEKYLKEKTLNKHKYEFEQQKIDQLTTKQKLFYYGIDAVFIYCASLSLRNMIFKKSGNSFLRKNKWADFLLPVIYLNFRAKEEQKELNSNGSNFQKQFYDKLESQSEQAQAMKKYNVQFWGNSQYWH